MLGFNPTFHQDFKNYLFIFRWSLIRMACLSVEWTGGSKNKYFVVVDVNLDTSMLVLTDVDKHLNGKSQHHITIVNPTWKTTLK